MIIGERHNLPAIWRGRDWDYTFLFRQGDEDSEPLDLTGWTAKMELRDGKSEMPGDAPLIIAVTIAIPIPTDGRVICTLTDTQTAVITQDLAYYDLLLTDTTDYDHHPVYGKVRIRGTGTLK